MIYLLFVQIVLSFSSLNDTIFTLKTKQTALISLSLLLDVLFPNKCINNKIHILSICQNVFCWHWKIYAEKKNDFVLLKFCYFIFSGDIIYSFCFNIQSKQMKKSWRNIFNTFWQLFFQNRQIKFFFVFLSMSTYFKICLFFKLQLNGTILRFRKKWSGDIS